MRPVLALYIGGMGSRKQNFYNNLVGRYGFEQAAPEIQDLYLDGKKEEAGAAMPDELIDVVSLCGPRDVVRERLARVPRRGRRHADGQPDGVDGRGPRRAAARRRRARRLSAAGARLRLFLGAFGQPGHAFPMLALGAELAAAATRSLSRPGRAGADTSSASGMQFVAAPEYPVFPTRERPLTPYEAVVAGDAGDPPGDR